MKSTSKFILTNFCINIQNEVFVNNRTEQLLAITSIQFILELTQIRHLETYVDPILPVLEHCQPNEHLHKLFR